MFDRLIEMIMGVRVISKEDAKAKFAQAVEECDADADGYLSVREIIRVFKKVVRDGSQ